jgi:hypothetical protein
MAAEIAAKQCMHGAMQASEMTWFMVRNRKGALLPHTVRVEEGVRDSISMNADTNACGIVVGSCLITPAEVEEWRELVDMVAGGRRVNNENCFSFNNMWAKSALRCRHMCKPPLQ